MSVQVGNWGVYMRNSERPNRPLLPVSGAHKGGHVALSGNRLPARHRRRQTGRDAQSSICVHDGEPRRMKGHAATRDPFLVWIWNGDSAETLDLV